MNRWFLLLAAIASEVTASLALKGALERPWLYVIVALGFGTAFVLLSAVLRRGAALGVVYGIWGASGVAATSIFSALIYEEPFTGVMAIGILLIIGGVLTVELGAQATHKDSCTPVNGAA